MGFFDWLERRRQRKAQEEKYAKRAAAWIIRLTPMLTKWTNREEIQCNVCGGPILHEVLPGDEGQVFRCVNGCTRVRFDIARDGRIVLDPRFYLDETPAQQAPGNAENEEPRP